MFYCFIAFVLLSSSITINSHVFVADDEHEFSYDVRSPNGPSHWSEINPNWSLCNKGTRQSPIDLNEKAEVLFNLGKSRTSYKSENSVLVNGHSIELRWEGDAGYIEINGTEYDLKQCHWHSPSEHTINGKRFDLEVHLVHKSKTNKIAVVAILYKVGEPDSLLSMLSEHIETIKDTKGKESYVGVVDPIRLRIVTNQYYRYTGSLTTPPCTEEVVWTVLRQVQTVSNEQVKLLRDAIVDEYENNARPIQRLNSRDLLFYKPLI